MISRAGAHVSMVLVQMVRVPRFGPLVSTIGSYM